MKRKMTLLLFFLVTTVGAAGATFLLRGIHYHDVDKGFAGGVVCFLFWSGAAMIIYLDEDAEGL